MFGKRKKQPTYSYDPEREEAVIRCSVCTGERVAGFLDRTTGHFTDVMLIHTEGDLETFRAIYQVDTVRRIY